MNNQTVNDYFKHHWAKLIVFVLFTAVVSFFAPLKSFQLKWLIDSKSKQEALGYMGLVFLITFTSWFFERLSRRSFTKLACGAVEQVRGQVMERVLHRPVSQYQREGDAAYLSLLTTDLRTLYDDYYMSIFNIVFWGGIMLCALGMYLYISPVMLAAILLVTVPPLELTRKIDRSVLLDPENGERLLNSITDERETRYRDPLTGAYNRTYYDENYRYRSITAGVAMLDMDDLKFSNDVYGSGAGNSVLETAVSTIRRGLSEKDRLIRYDGGRLLLLLPDHNHLLLNPELSERFLRLRPARFHNPGNHLLSFLHLCIHLHLLCRTLFRYRTAAIHHRIHHRLPSLLRCHQRLLPIQNIPAT